MLDPEPEVLDELTTTNNDDNNNNNNSQTFFITPQQSPVQATFINNNDKKNLVFVDAREQQQVKVTNNKGDNTIYDFMNELDKNIGEKVQVTTERRSNQMQDVIDEKLQIRILGISQNGAKSRVETQIKLCLQLVTEKGEKVTCWSHLQLPEWMVAKEKFKIKNSKNPSEYSSNISQDRILNLEASVVCASDTTKKVLTCLGCVQRERKRSQRKKENKKNNNDSDLMQQQHEQEREQKESSTNDNDESTDLDDEKMLQLDQNKILLFNCNEVVDFNSGDIILPTRITCYCRHHNEKVGFCIRFRIKDHTNNVIATGISPPIMITDDHKSSKSGTAKKRLRTERNHYNTSTNSSPKKRTNDRQQRFTSPPLPPSPTTTSSSSSSVYGDSNNNLTMSTSPIETQPDSSLLRAVTSNDTKNLLSFSTSSPQLSKNDIKKQQQQQISSYPLQVTPSYRFSILPLHFISQNLPNLSNNANPFNYQHQHNPRQFDQYFTVETSSSSYSHYNNDNNNIASSISANENAKFTNSSSINCSDSVYGPQPLQDFGKCPTKSTRFNNANAGNDVDLTRFHNSHISNNNNNNNSIIRGSLYNQNKRNLTNADAFTCHNNTISGFQIPKMNKLIPSEGPMHGGIEVTVLGSNFYDGLTCVFGGTPALRTQFWSSNALICHLPPSSTPGPVAVTFKEHPNQDFVIFNYTNDTDRALMELTLQVIGMEMTGKVEDALDIATRIVGNNNNNNSHFNNNFNNANYNSDSRHASNLDNVKSLLSDRNALDFKNFERNIISLICLMNDEIQTDYDDSISLQDRQRHTMLHFAAMLNYQKLCFALIEREIDMGVQDEHGFTDLHYAAWTGRREIVRSLLSGKIYLPIRSYKCFEHLLTVTGHVTHFNL